MAIVKSLPTIPPASEQVEQSKIASDKVIEAHNVCKQFDKQSPTIRNLSFEVERGQIFCLLGPSGSGKSTTMRMLTGVYRPSEGRLEVLGAEPHRFNRRERKRIGYMPQHFVLFPELSTLDNINFVASAYAMSWFGRSKLVREALEFVGLWEARDRLASQLSGGMRRRLDLASTLVHRPELIFVDEPTAGIDPVLRAKFWEHFNALRAEGRTLFVTTQYVTEADYCDVVAILNRGRLVALGTPEVLRYQAFGGGIINMRLEAVTSQAINLLKSLTGIKEVTPVSSEQLRLIVIDSAGFIKEIIQTFQQHNIELTSIEPYRPDFEEVFVRLISQDNDQSDEFSEELHLPPTATPRLSEVTIETNGAKEFKL